MLKFAKLFFVALLLFGCSAEEEQKPTTPLLIKTANGDVRFAVEVAQTPEELQKGLMHRTNLGFTNGMIFSIYPVRPTAMWMKNTKIPLDMLFIAPDATISMIKENAEPMSEELIISRDPVRAVLEINAGQVKRHGIKVGDTVSHSLLNSLLDTKTPGPDNGVNAPKEEAAPQADIPVPQMGKVIPKGGIVPKTGAIQPKTGAIVPKTGAIQPKTGTIVPKTGAIQPKTGAVPGGVVPKTGAIVPKTGVAAPGQQTGPVKLPVPAP
ncbi:MAG: DUF192 domain-containing protein [Alphaproteobacteria bacterium]|nr:DUF192 domain-containing protein [Alphaproteobacteria bacterium]